ILPTFLEERYRRASIAARIEAIDVYATSGSFIASLESGKKAFRKHVVGTYLSRPHIPSADSSRAIPELWLEASGDEESEASAPSG
ncbi:MAG TPA: hypothetical protein VNP73_06225, partial [Actinomycetota bacterium]|nr:hypothetical protein [Actinomycetota bacterium]